MAETEHGNIHLSTYLQQYKVGDIVDIKANAAQQKGMPHKYYQGFVFSLILRYIRNLGTLLSKHTQDTDPSILDAQVWSSTSPPTPSA